MLCSLSDYIIDKTTIDCHFFYSKPQDYIQYGRCVFFVVFLSILCPTKTRSRFIKVDSTSKLAIMSTNVSL